LLTLNTNQCQYFDKRCRYIDFELIDFK